MSRLEVAHGNDDVPYSIINSNMRSFLHWLYKQCHDKIRFTMLYISLWSDMAIIPEWQYSSTNNLNMFIVNELIFPLNLINVFIMDQLHVASVKIWNPNLWYLNKIYEEQWNNITH